MRRVDPDALFGFILNRWGQAVAAQVCPEVEPERPEPYDYHADWTRHPDPSGNNDVTWCCKYCDGWTDYRPKARHNCPDRPAEPVIDEAFVYAVETEAGISGFLTIKQAEEVIEKQTRIIRELRSNACGVSSERSSPVSSSEQSEPSGSSRGASGTASATEPAHAADPRRLDGEMAMAAYWRGWNSVEANHLAAAVLAVAVLEDAKPSWPLS